MDENTKEIIQNEFASLPEPIQKLILSPSYQKTLSEIGEEFGLNQKELYALEGETTLAVMGLSPLDKFEDGLVGSMYIEREKAQRIALEIDEKVFSLIRDLLEIMNEKDEDREHHWQQNLNFIMSGGDHEALMIPPTNENSYIPDTKSDNNQKVGGYVLENESKITDIKNKFLYNDKKGQ